jgi:hypothetical protein
MSSHPPSLSLPLEGGYQRRSELPIDAVTARAQRAGVYEHAVLLLDATTGATVLTLAVSTSESATELVDTVRHPRA